MKRRTFLTHSVGLVGASIPLLRSYAQTPCPPSQFSVDGGTPAASNCNVSSTAIQGLRFPSNNAVGSDIRLNWLGANLLNRKSQTVIWKVMHTQQSGYYSVTWNCSNDGEFHFDRYEFGAHPYPCAGTFDPDDGQSTQPTFENGTVHFFEIAGLGEAPARRFGHDYIASPARVSKLGNKQVLKGVWYTQARTVEILGDPADPNAIVRHKFYTDIGRDGHVIQQDIFNSSLTRLSTDSPEVFLFGASPWRSTAFGSTAAGTRNDECPSGVLRSLKLFEKALKIEDITAEAASGLNSAVTTEGRNSVWYINENPTPSDITDKSGANHTPTWANANRPTLWTP